MEAVVLHHEDPRVVQARDPGLGRRRADHEGRGEAGKDARDDSWGSERITASSQPGVRYS